ncbi:hypothetical protein E2I00_008823, partial [Balaenoptera physalus]
ASAAEPEISGRQRAPQSLPARKRPFPYVRLASRGYREFRMSLHIFSDENVTGDKSTENCDFLFSPPELTGRSSVLRLSQKENVPPKSTAKAMKVTFQTPLRDPQTHRILSPSTGSKLEACFALGDTIGLENCHQVWTQKENQQFTKETDTRTTNGILQKPAVADANSPSEDMRPASDDRRCSGPSLAPLACLDPASSSQMPESVENPEASPGQTSGSPEHTQEEHVHPHSLEESATSTSTILEDPPGMASQDRTEDLLRTTGENSSGVPAPSAGAASAPSTHPGEARGAEPLVDPPGEAPAGSKVTASREDTAPAGPVEAGGATFPSPQREEAEGQTADSLRSEPIRLEFDFSDATSKKPPPLRKQGKTPALRPPSRRPAARQEKEEKALMEAGEGPDPPPRGPNILDRGKLDDPDCNPAGGDGEARPPGHPRSGPATEASSPSRPVPTPWGRRSAAEVLAAGAELALVSPGHPARGVRLAAGVSLSVLGTGAEVDYLEQFGASSSLGRPLRTQTARVFSSGLSARGTDAHSSGSPLEAQLLDLDFAGAPGVGAMQKENEALRGSCTALQEKILEMGKIMDGFEGTVYQAMEEAQKQKELAKAEIQKNEESLKKCVEDSIGRLEKEGQRYQALKAHAEEKLQLANEEITQVRSKAQAEALALQAVLRKEQMRVHSLEKVVEQKVGTGAPRVQAECGKSSPPGSRSSGPAPSSERWEKSRDLIFLLQTKENDELTRICDDLISKMERI